MAPTRIRFHMARKQVARAGVGLAAALGFMRQRITFYPGAEVGWYGVATAAALAGLISPTRRLRVVAVVLAVALAGCAGMVPPSAYDPSTNQPVFAPIRVRVLSKHEMFAEKVRAALTRTEPAIRDFFDIDSAIQAKLVNHLDPDFVRMVGEKLSMPGNADIDISQRKVAILQDQIDAQLKPVLREADYGGFDLERVVGILAQISRRLSR